MARVRRTGRHATGAFVSVYVLRGREDGSRAAVVCGRHVGGSVIRNRARRLLREGWRSASSRLSADWDVVVVARPQIRSAGGREVAADLLEALASVGAVEA